MRKEGVVRKATEVEVRLPSPGTSAIGEHGGRRGVSQIGSDRAIGGALGSCFSPTISLIFSSF